MTPTFHAPCSFHPSYSLLGRAFRYWTGDRLRGEALFIVALTALALLLLMSHYLGWALLKPVLASSSSWQVLFWAGQLASVVALTAVGLVGFRPGVTVTCDPATLELEQGRTSATVRYDAIDQIETITAATYHRHYRRYAATHIFVSQLADEMLLLRTAQGPIVIALSDPNDRKALRAHLESVDVPASEPMPQP